SCAVKPSGTLSAALRSARSITSSSSAAWASAYLRPCPRAVRPSPCSLAGPRRPSALPPSPPVASLRDTSSHHGLGGAGSPGPAVVTTSLAVLGNNRPAERGRALEPEGEP